MRRLAFVLVAVLAVGSAGCVMSAADRADLIERAGQLAGDRTAALAEKASRAIIDQAIEAATKKAIAAGLSPAETERLAALARQAAEGTATKLVEEARIRAEAGARDLASRSAKESEDGKANVLGKILAVVAGIIGVGGTMAFKGATGAGVAA